MRRLENKEIAERKRNHTTTTTSTTTMQASKPWMICCAHNVPSHLHILSSCVQNKIKTPLARDASVPTHLSTPRIIRVRNDLTGHTLLLYLSQTCTYIRIRGRYLDMFMMLSSVCFCALLMYYDSYTTFFFFLLCVPFNFCFVSGMLNVEICKQYIVASFMYFLIYILYFSSENI